MKVLAISGSMRRDKSLSNKVIYSLLKDKYWESWEKKVISMDKLNIFMCQGCCSCFASGKCLLKDDMNMVKEEIISSDVIIISSPVFLHHVPGSLKNLIDRISYWTHIFELLNKRVILCAATATTGCDYVLAYLKKAFSAMGAYIVEEIKADIHTNEEDLCKISENVIEKLQHSYLEKSINVSFYQEQLFQSLKEIYMQKNSHESNIWKCRGYFLCENFAELQNRL